jgi:hypothetical protein
MVRSSPHSSPQPTTVLTSILCPPGLQQVFTFGLQEKLEKKAATDDDEKTPLRRYLDHIALVSDSHDSKNDKSPVNCLSFDSASPRTTH